MTGSARSKTARFVAPAIWISIALIAFCVGGILDAGRFSFLAAVPVVIAAIAFVLRSRRSSLAAALIASLVLLAVSRSALTPDGLTTTTPLVVVALLLLACALSWKRLILPKSSILVAALAALLIIPTALSTDSSTTGKTLGIGAMWLLVFFAAANLQSGERRRLLQVFLGLAIITAVIAVCETIFDSPFVREFIAGSATTESYIIRDNRMLGDWTNRAQGTFGYPIPFAAFLSVALLVTLLSNLVSRLPVRILIVALLGSAILLTGTRSAIAALAVGLGVYCVSRIINARSSGDSLRKLALPLAGTAILGLAGLVFLLRSIATQDFSLLHRGSIIEAAMDLLALPPMALIFGSGYNSAPALFEAGVLHSEGLRVIDNALISQVIVSGLLGLAVLVALLVFAVRNSKATGRAVIGALVTFCFFFDVMSWHAVTFLLFVAIGFATPAWTVRTPPPGLRQLPRALVSPAYL